MTTTSHACPPSGNFERGRCAPRFARIASVAGKSVLALGLLCGHTPMALAADKSEGSTSQLMTDEHFAIHGQLTYVEQDTNGFSAPYSGANSLSRSTGRETVDATLFLGARLWPGAEGWITPEIDQGFGLDNTLGVAGFPSGEAYKSGKSSRIFACRGRSVA